MSGNVKIYGGGNSFEPGIVTTFPANTVPYINGSQTTAYDANFTYQSGQLGIGIASSLGATLHVKGANDSTGSATKIQTATYEVINVYNNRKVVFGGASTVSGTDYLMSAFGTGAADTDTTLTVNGASSDNIFRFMNSPGYTRGGLEIARSIASSSRTAFNIYGGGTSYFNITSNGIMSFATETAWADSDGTYIQRSSSTGKKGLFFNVTNAGDYGFVFHQGRTIMGVTSVPFMRLYTDFSSSGSGSATQTFFKIDPSYNYTGSGAITLIGMDYAPTMTSYTGGGIHYGLLIREGLAGFGLGSTLPTAVVSIAASTTARASLNIPAGTAPSSPNNGDFWVEGSDLKFRIGGTTYTITKV